LDNFSIARLSFRNRSENKSKLSAQPVASLVFFFILYFRKKKQEKIEGQIFEEKKNKFIQIIFFNEETNLFLAQIL